MSGSSIPKYPYKSACACASARVSDEDDSSDWWTVGGVSVLCKPEKCVAYRNCGAIGQR